MAAAGAVFIALGIVSKAYAISLSYSISNLGFADYDSFDYKDWLAVGGKAYNATAYVRGNEYIYYNDGTQEYLGSLDTSPGFNPTRAVAINTKNQVVGSSGYAQAFFWSRETGITQVRGKGPGCGCYTSVSDINNLGQVVGTAGAPSAGINGFINTNGSAISIGVLPGYYLALGGTVGYGINDKGQVVGTQGSSSTLELLAILYNEGKLYDLNKLIKDNPGWSLERAFDINNQGQIVGTGIFNGQSQTFLATPITSEDIPEPSQALGILTFGAIGAGWTFKRQLNKQKRVKV